MLLTNIKLLSLVLVLSGLFLLPGVILADTFETINNGLEDTAKETGFTKDGKSSVSLIEAFPTYFTGLASILSALAVVLVIYAGWLWMTAQGKEEQVEQAKKILLGAMIGLAIIIGARLIAELAITILGTSIGQK